MDKQTDNILHEAAGPCNAELDGLIGETLRRRADKVPTLSDDFEERVMARIKPLSAMPTRMEGQASRRSSWKVWAWFSGVAAVCIAIYIMIGGRAPTTVAPQGHDMPTGAPSLLAENPKDPKGSKAPNSPNETKAPKETMALNAPKVPKAPLHKPVASTPSPRGGHGVRGGGGGRIHIFLPSGRAGEGVSGSGRDFRNPSPHTGRPLRCHRPNDERGHRGGRPHDGRGLGARIYRRCAVIILHV